MSKRREKSNKQTRWDRIRKRYLNANPLGLKTDAVRRFIELDYIGQRQSQMLIDGEQSNKLNPSVVMDMRHQMFSQIPRQLPLATVAHGSTLASTRAHNLEVEQRYIDNQLQKFRQQLARQHPPRQRQERKIRVRPTKPDFKLNHGPLMQSLTLASQHIDNFYQTPVDALGQAAMLCSMQKQVATVSLLQQLQAEPEAEAEADLEHTWLQLKQAKEVKQVQIQADGEQLDMLEYRKFVKQVELDESKLQFLQRCRTPSPLLTTEELLKPMRAAAERQMLHMRTVRQEEELLQQGQQQEHPSEQPQLHRQASTCSNTSDGIDSVISDLAEEALFELQLEAAEQQMEREQQQLNELVAPPKLVQFQLSTTSPEELTAAVQEEEQEEEQMEALLIRRIEIPKVVVLPKQQEQPATDQSCSENELQPGPLDEKQRIIDELFVKARTNSELNLMRKYFLKWIHFTTMEKLEREPGTRHANRATKINAFLDKIRQEKRRQRQNTKRPNTPDNAEKIAQKSLEQREEAVKMAKQFKNKYES
ncbi:GH24999 [Drosophila grimshawi]|uniref:GH24999 n=1 Tax=Drosophila grimshawi TaxID=7222 RepID=B4K349_DROGR|nr:GH24999 [Drosophila grimshawi]